MKWKEGGGGALIRKANGENQTSRGAWRELDKSRVLARARQVEGLGETQTSRGAWREPDKSICLRGEGARRWKQATRNEMGMQQTSTSSAFFLSMAFFKKVFEVSLTFSRLCIRAEEVTSA